VLLDVYNDDDDDDELMTGLAVEAHLHAVTPCPSRRSVLAVKPALPLSENLCNIANSALS